MRRRQHGKGRAGRRARLVGLVAGVALVAALIPGGVFAQEDPPVTWPVDPPPTTTAPPPTPTTAPWWDQPEPTPTTAPAPTPTTAPSPSPRPTPRPTPVVVTTTVPDDGPSSMEMSITTSPNPVPQTGGLVLFDVTIVNTSAADSVTIESIVDDIYGDISSSCLPTLPVSVAPEGSILCSFRERVAADTSLQVINSMTATGTDDDGEPVSAEANVLLDVTAAIDLEVLVAAGARNVRVGDDATWSVTVANRGPSEATSVRLKVSLPAEAAFVSDSCVLYKRSAERASVPCGFDAATGFSAVGSIPAGGALVMALIMNVDSVGDLEARAEVSSVDQADVDSIPSDRRGDDFDSDSILMTVELADSPLSAGGGAPASPLPLWPLALLGIVFALALARYRFAARWRFR